MLCLAAETHRPLFSSSAALAFLLIWSYSRAFFVLSRRFGFMTTIIKADATGAVLVTYHASGEFRARRKKAGRATRR